MVLQADGGHDHNCTRWRNISSLLMIMNELKLVHLIAMKNAGGNSMHNPTERAMGAVAFGSQCLALDRSEAPKEVEQKLMNAKALKLL